MNFLAALLPILSSLSQPVKDWFNFKHEEAKAERDYKLAVLQAQAEQAKQQAVSDSNDLQNRLNSTDKDFKQKTFWLLWFPVLFTMLFPDRAVQLWENYLLVPTEFRYLFQAVYCAIWGLPWLKNGYGAVTDLLQQRRDYKLEVKKAQYNRKAVFDTIKQMFPKGMNQDQVAIVDKALDAGEQ